MAEETEREKHLMKVIAFERKQYAEERERRGIYIDHLEKLARKNHAIRLIELLETVNWEGGPDKLTKAQAKGAEAVVKILRRLAETELETGETAGQEPAEK
jgi:hypothetical protein